MTARRTEVEADAMRRAVDLASRGLGRTSPNPVVGCVILNANLEVVGEGTHARVGESHAEVQALESAGNHARGATAVVTLEPCAHTGRTGPCVDALINAGITRVVYAVDDPNPLAAGGAQALRAHGVEVHRAESTQAEHVNRAWLHAQRTGRPFVTWKFASTLDGYVAATDGTSRWITGVDARADVHVLRDRVDAVLVGTGTAIADDPALTVRGVPAAKERQPLRVVMGNRALPIGARLLDDSAPTLLIASSAPSEALQELFDRNIRSVLLEGGPSLAASFLAAGLVDEIVAYVSPTLLGSGRPALGDLGITSIQDAVRWNLVDTQVIGNDVRLTAHPTSTEA